MHWDKIGKMVTWTKCDFPWNGQNPDAFECVCVYAEPAPHNSFLDALRLFPNQKMWDHVYFDEDKESILHALLTGTLGIPHDGESFK